MKVGKVEKDARSKITKYDMHVSCLFVSNICIIIRDNDNTIQHVQSNLFNLSYMTVIIVHLKMKSRKSCKG